MGQVFSDIQSEPERVPRAVMALDDLVWGQKEAVRLADIHRVLLEHRIHSRAGMQAIVEHVAERKDEQMRKYERFKANECVNMRTFHFTIHGRYDSVCYFVKHCQTYPPEY